MRILLVTPDYDKVVTSNAVSMLSQAVRPTFEQFGEHDRVFLMEIRDRTIAKENGSSRVTAIAAHLAVAPSRRRMWRRCPTSDAPVSQMRC